MLNRRTLLSIAVVAAVVFATALVPASAESALPFKLYDTHVHFVSGDFERYPMRTDPAPNDHERGMREYVRQNPTGADRILNLWDANGVEAGVAVQYRTAYDTNNSYLLDAANQHPARVVGVVIFEPADRKTPDLLRSMVKDYGAAGIRMTGSKDRATGEFPWLDSPAALNTWSVADELGIVVELMPGPVYRLNPEAMERIGKLAKRFPNARIVLDHLTWPAPEGAPTFGLSPEHLALKSLTNIYFKFTTLNLQELEKAQVSAADFVRHVVNVYGADRVMWGSDLGNSKQGYADLVRSAIAATTKLTPSEQRQILRETGIAVHVAGGRRTNP
jgi:L-fuconolactonase